MHLVGAGGSIPAVGTGGGTGVNWPGNIAPLDATKFRSVVTVPPGAERFTSIEIYGLSHSWSADTFCVLFSPELRCYTIFSRPGYSTTTPNNGSGDFTGGNYTFVTSGATPFPHTAASDIPAGVYNQDFGLSPNGVWPTGAASIFNTPIDQINVVPGDWELWIYDWADQDSGLCLGWALNGWKTPEAYCTSGTSLGGCVPMLDGANDPKVGNTAPCVVSANLLPGQRNGLVFFGADNSNWSPLTWAPGSSSFLCVKPPTQRTPVQSTGGTNGQCDGTLSLDWTAFQLANPISLGAPWNAGESVYLQGWYRDPGAVKATNTTNGLRLKYLP